LRTDRSAGRAAREQGHTDAVTSAVFAPDGGRILTASSDNMARLWDRDGKPLATLQGHTDAVTSAVFAPGGRILTASSDNMARLWDRDGKPLATLQGHTGTVYSAVFALDGGRILTTRRGCGTATASRSPPSRAIPARSTVRCSRPTAAAS
jgi:WD40 repeat protein